MIADEPSFRFCILKKYIFVAEKKGVMSDCKTLISKLEELQVLEKAEFVELISRHTEEDAQFLFERARAVREQVFGKSVFLRGLIEITNYCTNDCYYCGIRHSNSSAERYRLSEEDILECCEEGYRLGFRTFVMQGGEDGHFTDEVLVRLIRNIKARFPDCAVTLSLGERTKERYQKYFDAGADRYLLRHETANAQHYAMLHPAWMSYERRIQCLWDLKEIGYQVGTGFMVGTPHQTAEYLAEDMLFIKKLQPQMVGIGPFVPHHATPFANETGGTAAQTLFMLGLLRLMKPDLLLPSTTALGTIDKTGREKGLMAGANVVMPNLSPVSVRKKYDLYDNKICTGDESAQCVNCLEIRIAATGYKIKLSRGDAPGWTR